ncbi:hypothetical protein ACTHGU_14240 [Chitinophagaceae bacterium MMS25-I14]
MIARYKILFLVSLMHDYYADGKSADFNIVATPDTARILKAQGMMYKVVGNKLVVLVKVDDTGKTAIPFPAYKSLSFFMMIENVHFYNITNIGYQPATPYRFWFSNLNQTKTGTTLYLNNKAALYSSSGGYNIGSLAASGSGDVYEAIRASNSGNPHGLNDTAYWVNRGQVQYAGNADLVEIAGTPYPVTMPAPGTGFTVNVFSINPVTGVYDVPARDAVTQTFTEPRNVVQADLSGIPYGKYVVDVNGERRTVFLATDAPAQHVFSIIDIYNHLPPANDFALLDAVGAPKETAFTLRFANRSVIWKYFASGDIQSISDSGGSYSFSQDVANKCFYSDRPIPLNEKPVSTLSMMSVKFGQLTPVANPPTDRLSSIELSGETYFCVEKYLNY